MLHTFLETAERASTSHCKKSIILPNTCTHIPTHRKDFGHCNYIDSFSSTAACFETFYTESFNYFKNSNEKSFYFICIFIIFHC